MLWNKYGQPIWEGIARLLMQIFIVGSEVIGGHGNLGDRFHSGMAKAQNYGASKHSGDQMGYVLDRFRNSMPWDVAFTSPSRVTSEEYRQIQATRDAQIKAKGTPREGEANAAMDALDRQLLNTHGVTGKQAWDEFVAYKTELMNTIASRMGMVGEEL